MRPELEQKLKDKYPKLFAAIEENTPIAQRGIEAPDGWFDLVDTALAKLSMDSKVKLAQIKEKFGGLRIYCDDSTPGTFDLLKKIEDLSFSCCEICGKNATCSTLNYWTRTLCPEHWAEHKARKI